MVIFLDKYKNSSDSEKKFLEESLSYAIHDYLENHPEIKSKKLEEIVEETFLIEKNGKARRFIENLINKKDERFMKRINPYLLPFYR